MLALRVHLFVVAERDEAVKQCCERVSGTVTEGKTTRCLDAFMNMKQRNNKAFSKSNASVAITIDTEQHDL